jgi:hypothetical protein
LQLRVQQISWATFRGSSSSRPMQQLLVALRQRVVQQQAPRPSTWQPCLAAATSSPVLQRQQVAVVVQQQAPCPSTWQPCLAGATSSSRRSLVVVAAALRQCLEARP